MKGGLKMEIKIKFDEEQTESLKQMAKEQWSSPRQIIKSLLADKLNNKD